MYQFYFIPIRMATIFEKQQKITSVRKDVEKLEPLSMAGRNVKWCSCYEKHFGSSSNSFNRIENKDSNFYTSVHNSIIHNSQKMATTQLFIDIWIDKQNVVYTLNGILAIKRNELLIHAITCNEFWRHYAKWDKPDTKGQILHDSTYIKYLE